ncbi:Cytosolic phospholipase A2 zeta, partial [Ophiophagus hannah]
MNFLNSPAYGYFCDISQSDCYVSLFLPSASFETARTKNIKDCKDPVWNETFCYRIQNQVKVRHKVINITL